MDEVLRLRFQNGLSSARGDNNLRRLVRKFNSFVSAGELSDAHYNALLREIAILEATLRAHKNTARKFVDKGWKKTTLENVKGSITDAKGGLEKGRAGICTARDRKSKLDVCEELRQKVLEHPTRAETQKNIDGVEAEISGLNQEIDALENKTNKRKRQLYTLVQCVRDMNQAWDKERQEDPIGLLSDGPVSDQEDRQTKKSKVEPEVVVLE